MIRGLRKHVILSCWEKEKKSYDLRSQKTCNSVLLGSREEIRWCAVSDNMAQGLRKRFWYWLVPRRSQVGFLDKASKTKTKAFAKYKKHWTGAAGDNMAEGLVSAVKQPARRLGSIHGGRLNEGGRQKALAARSSAALLRCSGLWNVLHAVKVASGSRAPPVFSRSLQQVPSSCKSMLGWSHKDLRLWVQHAWFYTVLYQCISTIFRFMVGFIILHVWFIIIICMVGLYYFYFIFTVMAQLSVINWIITIIKYNLSYMSYFIPFITVSCAITAPTIHFSMPSSGRRTLRREPSGGRHGCRARSVGRLQRCRGEHTIIWVNYNDLTATSLELWLIREMIPKWPYFRFVNYYNLPRIIIFHSNFIVFHRKNHIW